jgi:hypothetical protein
LQNECLQLVSRKDDGGKLSMHTGHSEEEDSIGLSTLRSCCGIRVSVSRHG